MPIAASSSAYTADCDGRSHHDVSGLGQHCAADTRKDRRDVMPAKRPVEVEWTTRALVAVQSVVRGCHSQRKRLG